jgi:hypothetical protein
MVQMHFSSIQREGKSICSGPKTKGKPTKQRRQSLAEKSGRRFIVTDNGFMGIAPFWVKEGDKFAILFGCNVPVLLGKCQDDSTHFNLKGDCFVWGWMRGEILETFGI